MKKICFSKSNMFWIFILMTIAATLSIGVMLINAAEKDRKTETKSKAPVPVDAQNALCQKVSILIKNKTILKYQLDSVHVPDTPNTDSYLNIDIDGDDISDKIVRGCGTSECELVIELSSDGKIEFGNGHFFIIRFEGQLYLLSVETRDLNAPIQNPIFTLYSVKIDGVQQVCDTHKDTYKERR